MCAQAQPTNVAARNGYAPNGNGADSGVSPAPLNIRAAVAVNNAAAMPPVSRTSDGTAGDALTSASPAAHSPAPAANAGDAAASGSAEVDTINVSPAKKTRKPAASCSSPRRRWWTVSSAHATTMAVPSIPHARPRKPADGANEPATP